MVGCLKTLIQVSLLGFVIFFIANCNNDPGSGPAPVPEKPDYCNTYTLLSDIADDAISIKIWCACEDEGFDLAAATQRFTDVRIIDFRCNNLEDLPTFPTLEFMTVNSYVDLPNEIANNPSIKRLTLEGEGVTTLPPNIVAMTNLTRLEVYGENFFIVPAAFENIPKLEYVEFRSNSIFNIPDVFGGVDSLKEITFTDNPIKEFPTELLRVKSLETLTLDNCQLEEFPYGLDSLPNLVRLSLKNDMSLSSIENANQIDNVPVRVGDLVGLEQLNLSNLNIGQLPSEISNLAGSLRWLYLQNCPMSASAKANLEIWLPDTEIFY